MQAYFATEEHIRRLMWTVIEAELSAPKAFDSADVETLLVVYNGIGPDRWSDRFRRLTTQLLDVYEPEALIHDWEYTFQPKTYRAFTAANWRFAVNAARYARYYKRGRRYVLRGALLALLCQLFGWHGWRTATYGTYLCAFGASRSGWRTATSCTALCAGGASRAGRRGGIGG